MRMNWLVCVLLSVPTWAQSAQSAPPSSRSQAPTSQQAPADASASVADNAAVLTISGVCSSRAKAAESSSDCKTILTKSEFERLASALVPNASPQQKKQLASVLPKLIAMSSQAKERGMDQTEQYTATMDYVKMQVLANLLQRKLQEEAADISDADIEKYYKENASTFEQYNLDRIFVPRAKQVEAEAATDDEKDGKLTAEQKKTREDAEQVKNQQNEEAMTKLADKLRVRAAAGEDITKLQKEAYDAAGMKIESPTVALPNVRRNGLPQAHAVVFDLKPGEVSQVINDAGGHYIYKMNGKMMMPLDQAKNEIRSRMQNDRMREKTDKLNASFSSVTNETYFGPGAAGTAAPSRVSHPQAGMQAPHGNHAVPGGASGDAGPGEQPSGGQTPAAQKN